MADVVLDASAVLAMLLNEPEAPAIRSAFAYSEARYIGVFNAFECELKLLKEYGPKGLSAFRSFIATHHVEIVAFDLNQQQIAIDAYHRFGRGIHPAKLNMGDCCAYAAARIKDAPLLCKGDDFPQTDLPLVPW